MYGDAISGPLVSSPSRSSSSSEAFFVLVNFGYHNHIPYGGRFDFYVIVFLTVCSYTSRKYWNLAIWLLFRFYVIINKEERKLMATGCLLYCTAVLRSAAEFVNFLHRFEG